MTRLVLISKDTNYSSADVVDGTREHPYKLGNTISFTFYGYDDVIGQLHAYTQLTSEPRRNEEIVGIFLYRCMVYKRAYKAE